MEVPFKEKVIEVCIPRSFEIEKNIAVLSDEETLLEPKDIESTKEDNCSDDGSCDSDFIDSFDEGANYFKCKVCKAIFIYESSLKAHQLKHGKGQRNHLHHCQECQKTFRYPSTLQRHMLMHTKRRQFPCPLCKKTFRQNEHLKSHALIHEDLRPFACDECPLTFKWKRNLDQHMWRHRDARPMYHCDLCPKAFRARFNLRTHEKRVHHLASKGHKAKAWLVNSMKDLPTHYACFHCEQTFKNKRALERHKATYYPECAKPMVFQKGSK